MGPGLCVKGVGILNQLAGVLRVRMIHTCAMPEMAMQATMRSRLLMCVMACVYRSVVLEPLVGVLARAKESESTFPGPVRAV